MLPAPGWTMVCCKSCGLLVGWSREPVREFYCIPHFDDVAHIPDATPTITNKIPEPHQ
jgi:hypothetical protein